MLNHKTFYVAFSGGSVVKALAAGLLRPEIRDRIDWAHVEVFLADERCVPLDHPDSNFCALKVALFDKVPIPPSSLHAIDTSLLHSAAACASKYEQIVLQTVLQRTEQKEAVSDERQQGRDRYNAVPVF
ncbi:MAG TPA: 6-phosphogluconolactonase, partial [Oculatellaceae cyanobacterium]